MDSSNRFLVRATPNAVGFQLPIRNSQASVIDEVIKVGLSREEALNLGTWLVALADPRGGEFNALYDSVLGS